MEYPIRRSRTPALSTVHGGLKTALYKRPRRQARMIHVRVTILGAKSVLLPLPSGGRRLQTMSDHPFRHTSHRLSGNATRHAIFYCQRKLAVSGHHQSEDAIHVLYCRWVWISADRRRFKERDTESSLRLSSPHELTHGRPHVPTEAQLITDAVFAVWGTHDLCSRICLSESLVSSLILLEPIATAIAYASNRRLHSPFYRRIMQS